MQKIYDVEESENLDNAFHILFFKLEQNMKHYDNNYLSKKNNLKIIKLEPNGIKLPTKPLFIKGSKRDKIYENDYNYGTINLTFDQDLKVDTEYESTLMCDVRKPEDNNLKKMIVNDCYDIFIESKMDINNKNKKYILDNYNFILNRLSNSIYAKYLIFISYCDILNIKYQIFWKVINEKQQYDILYELSEIVEDIEIYNKDFNIF